MVMSVKYDRGWEDDFSGWLNKLEQLPTNFFPSRFSKTAHDYCHEDNEFFYLSAKFGKIVTN